MERTKKLLEYLAVPNAEEKQNKMEKYGKELLAWNGKVNLTGVSQIRDLDQKHFADSIVIAGLIGISFFGNESFLGHLYVKRLGWDMLFPAILTVVICGLLGGLFSRVMVKSITNMPSPLNNLYQKYPLYFMAALGLFLAVIGIATKGGTFGGGAESVRDMLNGELEQTIWFAPLKLISTWLTSWAGIPGGIFAPSLSVGAGIGQDVARLLAHQELYEPLIAIGMSAFLAAITQAPLTSFIIVMEMVDGGAMVLTLMTASMASSLIARLTGEPLYPALAAHMLAAIKNSSQNLPSTSLGQDG